MKSEIHACIHVSAHLPPTITSSDGPNLTATEAGTHRRENNRRTIYTKLGVRQDINNF